MSLEERLDDFCHEARQEGDRQRMKEINEELLVEMVERWNDRKIPRSKDREKTRTEDEFIVKQLTKNYPDLAPEFRRRVHALRRMEILGFPLNPK